MLVFLIINVVAWEEEPTYIYWILCGFSTFLSSAFWICGCLAEKSARAKEASKLRVATMQANTALPYILQHVKSSDGMPMEQTDMSSEIVKPYMLYNGSGDGGGGGDQPAQIYHPFEAGSSPSPRLVISSDIEMAVVSKK
jgi:hypothetical protein